MITRVTFCNLTFCILLSIVPAPLNAQQQSQILPQLRRSHYSERLPKIPADFTYKGKPIEPVCLQKLFSDESQSVLLETCPRPARILDCLLSQNHDNDPWWDLRGYHGYCYMASEQGPGGSIERQYNIIYKYLGRVDGHHAVLAESGAGTSASGVERKVMLLDVTRSPRALLLAKTFSNGSLVPLDARISGNKVLYTASAQAPQLAELSGIDLDGVGLSPSDFPDSRRMADCDVVEFESGLLKQIWLMPHNRVQTSHGESRQAKCFEENHQRYLDEKRNELSAGALQAFMKEVIACIRATR